MRYIRGVIIGVIVLVITFFIGSTLRSYYLFLKEPVIPIFDALPENTAIVIRTKSVEKLLDAINNSAVADLFPAKSYYSLINSCIDSIKQEDNLSALLMSGEAVFAFTGEKNSNLLIGLSIGKTRFNNVNGTIIDMVERNGWSLVENESGVYKINRSEGPAWYYIRNGLFMISPDSLTLCRSLTAISSKKKLITDKAFSKLINSTGKSSIGNILINNKLWSQNVWPEKAPQLASGTPFDSWSSFDITIKKGEVALGGFTYTPSSHVFKGQQPVQFDQIKYFPSNTAFSISLSLSDQHLYTSQFIRKDTLHVRGYDAAIKQNTNEIFNPSLHLNGWIGNSVSLICTRNFFRGNTSERLIMVSSRNKDSAAYYLKPYIEPINDSLGRMHYSKLTSDIWGSMFTLPNDNVYCLVSNQFIAFSPSKNLLNDLSNSRIRNKELHNLEQVTGSSNNIFIYLKPEIITDWLIKKNNKTGVDFIRFLGKNKSIGIEYSADEEMQYTYAWMMLSPKKSLTAQRQSDINESEMVTSSTENQNTNPEPVEPADADLSVKIELPDGYYAPILVNGKSKNQKRIAVLTKKGKLSLYDHAGNLLWSYKCKESTFNSVLEADINKNGKNHYLIFSTDKLYIIDQDGKELKDSPISLPGDIAGGISLFDYDQKKDYRLLYIGKDHRIYNITLKGKELPDWNKPEVKGIGKIGFRRTGAKDYIIYQYEDEQIKFFDRRGKERIKPDGNFTVSPLSDIYNNKTNSKGIFLTVNANGEMVYVTENGVCSKSSFGKFGTNTWFHYFDFNADGSMDFIFAKNNRIVAYTKMKNVIAECMIREGYFGIPFIYSASANENWIFARNQKTGEILAFNNKKRNYPVKITSDHDPLVFNPGGSLKEILVTIKDDKLILTELSDL